jgi:hypothetical protein
MKTAKTLTWWLVGLGIWQIVAAFVFGYWVSPLALWNAVIAGVLVVALALLANRRENARYDEGLDWAIATVGLWLLIAPFAMAYNTLVPLAGWNDPIVGVLVMVLALRSATVLRREIAAGQN